MNAGETVNPRPADDKTKSAVLLCATIGAGVVFLDSSVATVALPAVQRDLGLTLSQQQWVVSAYLLTLSALLLVGGRLGDLYGRRRLFRSGLAAYAVFSIAAGLAPSGASLVTVRALQGVAGAALAPSTLALINSVYPPRERGAAIGKWAAWSGVVTVVGPIVGGLMIDRLSWRYAFAITPVLVVMALWAARSIPESRDEDARGGFDPLGIALAAASVGSIVFALVEGPANGWGSPAVLVSAATALVLSPAFVLWERRFASPVIPPGMFADRSVAIANVVTFFVYAGLYGSFFYVPLYMQSAMGESATAAATIFIPVTVLLFLLSPYAGRLNDRLGPRWLLCFGPLGAAAGLVVMSLTGVGQLLTVLLPGIALFGAGLGFTVAPVTASAIGSAARRYSGVASGFNNAVSRVAGLVAIAFMGTIVVYLWHAGLSTAGEGATQPVVVALAAVSDKAFVSPETHSLSRADAAEAKQRATAAARMAFRYGMWLAAALVAAGGVVAAVGLGGQKPAVSG